MSNTYTFTSIISKPLAYSNQTVSIARVVIPRIQRAYAQGRKTEKESKIRAEFLDSIFDHLISVPPKPMDLHFIYGAVKTYNDPTSGVQHQLELLDGQQRFTTLYLLHWFLMNYESDDINDSTKQSIENALKSFVYETRSTTTEFCRSLAKFRCNIGSKSPSEIIRKARWYYHRFDKDSSINGMLVMLDAIHKKYNDCNASHLVDKLDLLQFYVLPLVDYDLSEDLYIKMNQRGLSLSPFDNFKADFTGTMKAMENVPGLSKQVTLEDGNQVTYREQLSINIDTKWTDLFWDPSIKNFDASYLRFFSRFFAYRYILDSGVTARQMQDTDLPINIFFTQSEDKKNINEYLGFEKYDEILKSHSDYFEKIEKILDTLHDQTKHNAIIESLKPAWSDKNVGDFFVDANVDFSQSMLVVFGSICEFVLTFQTFNFEMFGYWMRMVWNIVENTNIDSLTAATGPLRNLSFMIQEISKQTISNKSDFFNAVAKSTVNNRSRALQEEIEKAKCIAEDTKWLDEFIIAEEHPYLKGSVAFFFDENMTIDEFIHNRDLVMDMFDENGITDKYKERHVLIRAIISNLKTWDEKGLKDRYITEKAETNKRLKLLLLGNDDVRCMFLSVLSSSKDGNEVKRSLYHAIATNIMPIDKDYWSNKFVLTHNALCTDVRLYDWMESQSSPVCVSEYKGHFAVSIRGVWYDRFIIDSERDKMANSLMPPSGIGMFYFGDGTGHATQKEYEKYHRYMATNVILFRNLDASGDISFRVGFMQDHRVRIYVQCNNEQQCNNVGDAIERQGINICTKVDKDEKRLYLDVDEDGNLLPDFRYLLKDEFDNKLKSKIYNRFTAVELAINQER